MKVQSLAECQGRRSLYNINKRSVVEIMKINYDYLPAQPENWNWNQYLCVCVCVFVCSARRSSDIWLWSVGHWLVSRSSVCNERKSTTLMVVVMLGMCSTSTRTTLGRKSYFMSLYFILFLPYTFFLFFRCVISQFNQVLLHLSASHIF